MGFRVSRRLRATQRDPDQEAERPPGTGPAAGGSAQRGDESAQPGVGTSSATPTAVVPRWIQLVVLPLGLLGLWALARAAGPVLLVLIAASTVALILNPLVQRLHRHHVPRGLAILI